MKLTKPQRAALQYFQAVADGVAWGQLPECPSTLVVQNVVRMGLVTREHSVDRVVSDTVLHFQALTDLGRAMLAPASVKAGRCEMTGETVIVRSPAGSYHCPGCNAELSYSGASAAVDGFDVVVAAHVDATRAVR